MITNAKIYAYYLNKIMAWTKTSNTELSKAVGCSNVSISQIANGKYYPKGRLGERIFTYLKEKEVR